MRRNREEEGSTRGIKMLTIRLELMVVVVIGVFNARPENFKPEFFFTVQLYDFPPYCTWALKICCEELVTAQTCNSDWYQSYSVMEKKSIRPPSVLCCTLRKGVVCH